MKVFVGKQGVNLTKVHFVAQGGEGSVYVRDRLAYKIYTSRSKMIPPAKVRELAVLTTPEVIRPQDVLTNAKGEAIGYTMAAVSDTHPLCKLFTKAFKQRHGLDPNDALRLVQSMRATMEFVHSKRVLVVDANELNFLVDAGFSLVYFIDVDSYQTPSYPATAIMDSIRDYHAHGFTEGSDWFSWGVITFQLLTGIHPYKGKHPSAARLDERMQRNLSVFGKDVKVPAICPVFGDVIPANYLDWYRAVFEDGKRVPPPVDLVASMVLSAPVVKTVQGTGNFDINLIEDAGAEIAEALYTLRWLGAGLLARTSEGVYYQGRMDRNLAEAQDPHFTVLSDTSKPVAVWRSPAGTVTVRPVFAGQPYDSQLDADSLTAYRGTVYAKIGDGLYELLVRSMSDTRLVVGPKRCANVMHKATTLYDGVAITDMLGEWFAVIFPEQGKTYTASLPELRGCKIVDAKFDGGVLVVVASKGGKLDRHLFKFDEGYKHHSVWTTKDVADADINFVVLDSGVGAIIPEDGVLELFHRSTRKKDRKVVNDPVITTDMRLFTDGASVRFFQGSKIYSLKMK